MNSDTYNAVARLLAIGSLLALAMGILCLVVAIAGWRRPYKRRWLLASAACIAAFPLIGASIYVVRDHVYLPALATENERRLQEYLATALLANMDDDAPELSLTDVDGNQFVLADHKGKVVLVNFFATWCGPCWRELPHIQRIWEENKDNEQFALIVIGCKETDESVKAFQAKNGYSFPLAADPDGSQYGRYAQRILPNTFIIAPDGRIVYAAAGFEEVDAEALRSELNRQLALIR